MKRLALLLLAALVCLPAFSGNPLDDKLPVRGFAIEAPSPRGLDQFIRFIEEDLAPAGFNLLILRVDWNYAYESHPELRDPDPLSRQDAGRIVSACRAHGIKLVPHINLLGHQSWEKQTNALLRIYPQFDETPSVKTEDYSDWPNDDGLYCKSYCPLHPDVHPIVFSLIDELCDAFEADSFHAGMDEVFYIGMDECPRCKGHDRAELFAGEVTLLRDHLAERGRGLMIWGDRLLDGTVTGLGEWEASTNGTAGAIDLIPRDVFICDWHYERAELTGVYFAMKGLPVAECGYRDADICEQQIRDLVRFREQTPEETSERLAGYIHTIWSSSGAFLRRYNAITRGEEMPGGRNGARREPEPGRDDVRAFIRVTEVFKDLQL